MSSFRTRKSARPIKHVANGGDDASPKVGLLKTLFRETKKGGLSKPRRRTLDDHDGVAQMSKKAVAIKLKELLNRKYPEYDDKYRLLNERDQLLNMARVKNFDINAKNAVVGTLTEMCPEKERYSRLMQRTVNYYEHNVDGVFNADKAVKDYSRSAADQDLPLPHEMRPIATLQVTMDYLIYSVVNKVPESGPDLVRWYEFLWTRTRAIRKDITQQQLVNENVIDLIEKCARFHIFAGYQLSPLDATSFDQRMNIENLAKCLQSLRHCYHDLAQKNIFTPNEAEFRSYDILLNLIDSNVFTQASQLREEVLMDPRVKNALSIALAVHNENFARFFQLVARQDTSFLQACLCHSHFNSFREQMLLLASSSFSAGTVLSSLVPYLAFDDEKECLQFLTEHNVNIRESRAERTIMTMSKPVIVTEMKDSHSSIVAKKLNVTIGELINNGSVKSVIPPKATNSFDDNDRYVNDPVIKAFLAEAAVDDTTEAEASEKPATGFSFGPSVTKPPAGTTLLLPSNIFPTKNLFPPGYGDDPQKPVGTKLFVPGKFKSSFGGSVGNVDEQPASALPAFPSFKPKAVSLADATAKVSQSGFLGASTIDEPAPLLAPKPVVIETPKAPTPPPPGPTPAELEAIAKQKADEERLQREAEAAKRKQVRSTVANAVVEKLFATAIENVLKNTSEAAVKYVGEEKKRRFRLVRRTARDIFNSIIEARVTAIVDESCNLTRRRWRRLQVISANLRDIWHKQLSQHCVKVWRWYSRRQRELRALKTFSDAFKRPRYDGINGAAKQVTLTVASRVSDADILNLNFLTVVRWRAERLGRRCIQRWKDYVAMKKRNRYEEMLRRRAEMDAVSNLSLPSNMIEKHVEFHRPLVAIFQARKRSSDSVPLTPLSGISSKRSFRMMTSTPVTSKEQMNRSLPVFDLSPVIRRESSVSTDVMIRGTLRNGVGNENLQLLELKNAIDDMSDGLRQAKQQSEDFLRRYSHYLK